MSEISSISQSVNTDYLEKYGANSSSTSSSAVNTDAVEEKVKTATVSSSDVAKAAASTINTQSDSEIISEIKLNGMAATKSVQQIAQDYHISVSRAQKILDKINDNGSQGTEETTTTQEHTVEPEMSNAYTYSKEEVSDTENSTMEYSV